MDRISSDDEIKEIYEQCLEVWAAVSRTPEAYTEKQLADLWSLVEDTQKLADELVTQERKTS